jgi:hypothetical protein
LLLTLFCFLFFVFCFLFFVFVFLPRTQRRRTSRLSTNPDPGRHAADQFPAPLTPYLDHGIGDLTLWSSPATGLECGRVACTYFVWFLVFANKTKKKKKSESSLYQHKIHQPTDTNTPSTVTAAVPVRSRCP